MDTLEAYCVSSHTEELWYNETVCLWMTIYIYIYIWRDLLTHISINEQIEWQRERMMKYVNVDWQKLFAWQTANIKSCGQVKVGKQDNLAIFIYIYIYIYIYILFCSYQSHSVLIHTCVCLCACVCLYLSILSMCMCVFCVCICLYLCI